MQKFNDDLLLTPADQERALQAFPVLFPILDNEKLRELFNKSEEPAKRAKRKSLRAGIIAVLLVVIALCGTSAEPLYAHYAPDYLRLASSLSAVLGLIGALIGLFGLMIGRAKENWLHERMATELLRQFHFQTFVCRTAEILASLQGDGERDQFLAERKKWLSALRFDFLEHLPAKLQTLMKHQEGVWLHPPPSAPNKATLAALPAEFFDAYRTLRINHQQQYADWKLREGQMIFAGFSLRTLESLLAGGSVVCTLGLLITETFVIAPLAYFSENSPFSAWAHWFAICFAIIALGMRTAEEGLQPKREIERYHRYSSVIQDILERFDAGSRPAKFEAMIEMERLAFEEMRDFLRSNYESRFIM
jgi:hypothetical protein